MPHNNHPKVSSKYASRLAEVQSLPGVKDVNPTRPRRTSPDKRYHNPRFLLPIPTAPSRKTSQSNIKVKRTWPPSPFVEDEKAALSKELNPPRVMDGDRAHTMRRGSIDQEPIILDAEGVWKDLEAQLEDISISNTTGLASRHSRPNVAPLDPSIAIPPSLGRREPSPYAFTPQDPAASSAARLRTSEASNKTSHAPPSRNHGHSAAMNYNQAPEPLRGKGKARNQDNIYSQPAEEIEGSVEDNRFAGQSTTIRQSSYLLSKSDLGSRVSNNGNRKDGSPPSSASIRSTVFTEPRRMSDSTLPRPRFDDPTRQHMSRPKQSRGGSCAEIPSPALTAGLSTRGTSSIPTPRPNSLQSALPNVQPKGHFSSPPSSPRTVQQRAPDTPSSGLSTAYSSQPSSRSASPAPNNASPRLDDKLRRAATLPTTSDYHPHAATVPGTVFAPYNDFIAPHILATMANSKTQLPYPATDARLMPSEHKHRSSLSTQDFGLQPNIMAGSSQTPYPPNPVVSLPRPTLNPRHGSEEEATAFGNSRASISPGLSATGFRTDTTSNRVICHRTEGCRGRDDWWTLEDSPYFRICPTCVDSTFTGTSFRKFFFRAPNANPNQIVKCSFGNPWMRMAWRLTQERMLYNLDLLQAVAYVESVEQRCPEDILENSTWYTLTDKRGRTLEDFYICVCDVRKMEMLFPSLRGFLVRRKSSSRKRRCDLRASSLQLGEYLNELVDVDAYAISRGRRPDLTRFFDLARQKTQHKECPRSTILHDEKWHFPPSLPEFTVCEDCYKSIVKPHAMNGSPVALQISQTPTYIINGRQSRRSSDMTTMSGTSCQLYSTRMRAVFEKAVVKNDHTYLATRAMDRKEVENELIQHELTLRLAEDAVIRAGGPSYSQDPEAWKGQPRYAGLVQELEKLRHEWTIYE